MACPVYVRRCGDSIRRRDVLHVKPIFGQLVTSIVKPLPANTICSLNNEAASVEPESIRPPNFQCLAFIERQKNMILSRLVRDEPMPIIHGAPKPVSEDTQRTVNLLGMIVEKCSYILRLALWFAEKAHHLLG